jgi:ArsR family transcriptional regulator
MKLTRIYQCLCDPTRLRILNLLGTGPLCVCHLQEILGESQVKVSKHLAYLRKHGMAESRREATWMIYGLPEKQSRELKANLACLQDCAREDKLFRSDAARLKAMQANSSDNCPDCCGPKGLRGKSLAAACC